MSPREDRIVENERAFRAANDRFSERAEEYVSQTTPIPFLCECADDRCLERIELRLVDYRALRTHRDQFVIVPGHRTLEHERVVDDAGRFQVVEKAAE